MNLRHQAAAGGTWTSVSNIDLRGFFPNLAAGGSTSGATEFADNVFRIFDDGDPTKEIAFQASSIATGNTRTITMADRDVSLISPTFSTLTVDAGNVDITAGNLTLPVTNSTYTQGTIFLGANRFMHMGVNAENTFLGTNAGVAGTASGGNNTGIGNEALTSLIVGGASNTAIGGRALKRLTSGTANVMVGSDAGAFITTSNENTGVGYLAYFNGTGQGNAVLGQAAMQNATSADFNTAIGKDALKTLTTGDYNCGLGYNAGFSLTVADSSNICIMNTGTAGDNNTIRIGTQGAGSGQQDTTFIAGIQATTITGSTSKPVIIETTGQLGTAGNLNLPDTNSALTDGVITFGATRHIHNFGVQNLFLGDGAGNGTLTVGSAQANCCLGFQSLAALTTGSGDNAIGFQALAAVTTGIRNDAMGYQAGVAITQGAENVCIGFFAGNDITTGSYNTFIGANAGSTTGIASSSNLYIKHVGASESNTMRIGTQGNGNGQQDRSFIAGIVGATNAGASTVPYIETATGQLATVPGGAVLMNTGTQSLSISSDASATTVNLATGAAAKTVTLGSTTTTSSLALKYGTADFTLASATGTVMSAIDTGEITCPLQPAFLAYLDATVSNVVGNSGTFTLGTTTALTEIFDQNSDFNTNGTFTAPVTGRYQINAGSLVVGCTIATTFNIRLVTSNRTYLFQLQRAAGAENLGLNGSALVDMDTADTMTVTVEVTGEAANTADVYGDATPTTFISGYLAC